MAENEEMWRTIILYVIMSYPTYTTYATDFYS